MKKKEHDEILRYYSDLYRQFGYNPASLGWPKGKQKIRFQAMVEIGKLNNSKILDVGCGFGHFSTFLNRKKIKVRYLGVDINAEFVKIAKIKNPNQRFQVRDIEKRRFNEKFDWVFAIGTTNKTGSYQYVSNLMKEMFKISKKGIAMDFLSTYVDYKKRGTFHASPERIFKIAKKLSKTESKKQICIINYLNQQKNRLLSLILEKKQGIIFRHIVFY